MAIKTGAQQPSEGSTNQCCAPAVLCLGTLLWNADRALSLLWAGHWTTDFPKSPSIWMSLHFRNIRKEVSDWHTHKDATHGTLLVPSHYKILEHLMGVIFISQGMIKPVHFESRVIHATAVKTQFWLCNSICAVCQMAHHSHDLLA